MIFTRSVSTILFLPLAFVFSNRVFGYRATEGIVEVPPYSTLNADVIPREDFINSVEKHMPKIDPDLIKDIWRTIGVQS